MKNNLSEQPLESLEKQKKLLKGAAIGLGIVLLLAFCIIMYVAINKHKYGLLAILPGSILTLLPIIIRFAQINTELNVRKTP
jgi:ABC-type Mn2+/Zn2+ transport system permease subunit